MVWSCITFSKTLETIGRSEIGLKFLGSVLVTYSLSESKIVFMDKLQKSEKGMANTSAPSFKNLPDTLSIPTALLTLHGFRRLEIVFG